MTTNRNENDNENNIDNRVLIKTAIPGVIDTNGNQSYDITRIPSRNNLNDERTISTTSSNDEHASSTAAKSKEIEEEFHKREESYDNNKETTTAHGTGEMNTMKDKVSKDENRLKKKLIRCVTGLLMVSSFSFIIYAGHIYACALVALLQVLLFKELVCVRYNAYFNTIQNTIPLFRTTQWFWFVVAIFYTYGDFVCDIIKSNSKLHGPFKIYVQLYYPTFSFFLYSSIFVLTVSTMQPGHIKFQLNQLCWTIVVLCITIGQTRYMMHNIYNGLFWFTLPAMLVITNDVWAYFCGITCGRKFIHRPFIAFSPNKTWEGFIGGGIFTVIVAWYLSRFLAQYKWMTCSTNKFTLKFHDDEFYTACDELQYKDHIFEESYQLIPSQLFEIFPNNLVRMIPGIKEICEIADVQQQKQVDDEMNSLFNDSSSSSNTNNNTTIPLLLRPCISGDEEQVHHHFELLIKNIYPVQIHALAVGLFASLVSPFGGFLASAIKRAYGLKNFNSIIPGHGGIMDRMDCQFLMALYTWVHYNTFVKMATVSVPKLIYMFNLLNDNEKQLFLQQIISSSSSSSTVSRSDGTAGSCSSSTSNTCDSRL